MIGGKQEFAREQYVLTSANNTCITRITHHTATFTSRSRTHCGDDRNIPTTLEASCQERRAEENKKQERVVEVLKRVYAMDSSVQIQTECD